jgi:hypothetical protein
MGRELGQSKYFARQRPIGNWTKAGDTIENLQTVRGGTRSVFPKRPGPGKQPGSTLRRSEWKEILSPSSGKVRIVPRAAATARLQKFAKEKAKGTINEKGLAALNKKPSPSGLSPRNFPKRGR